MDDSKLWECFLQGDNEAYRIIYKKHAKHLLLLGFKFSRDQGLVEDCIHDLFVHIYANRENLLEVKNVRVFLFVSLRNRIFNALKRANKNIYVPEFEEHKESLNTSVKTPEDLYIDLEKKERQHDLVQSMLSHLTPRQKEAVYYRYFESMTIDDISVLMEMNYQSVQNLLQRSISKIKESF